MIRSRSIFRWLAIAILFALVGAGLAILAGRVATAEKHSSAADDRAARAEAAAVALSDQVKRLCRDKECTPVVTVPPTGPAGEPGQVGPQGPPPTSSQVFQAVVAYCAPGVCSQRPSATQVASAVASYCEARSDCRGAHGTTGSAGTDGQNGTDGQDGAPGPAPTADQIAAAVNDYCTGHDNCRGPAGTDGKDGVDGKDGQSAFPFTFTFTVQNNPAQSTTYTVTCTADGCTVTENGGAQ